MGGYNYSSWVTVKEETSDPIGMLSEIQICGQNDVGDNYKVFVYVKYNRANTNTIYMSYKQLGFKPPTIYMTNETPSGYALNVNYALHDKGVFVNGENVLAKYETVEISANQLQNGFAKTNWGVLTFKKIGKIVFIVCNGVYPTSQITTDTVICDIPFPTPDSSPFYFAGTKSGGPFNNYWFGISNNKLICFGTNNMPASTWILFGTSYITN